MLGNGLPISTIHKRCDEDGRIIEDGTMHVIINYLPEKTKAGARPPEVL